MPIHQQSEKIILTHSTGASADVYFYGSTLTSWTVDGKERIFLRLEHSQGKTYYTVYFDAYCACIKEHSLTCMLA